MMELRLPIYILLVLITFISGYRRWNMLYKADKIITILMGLTLVQELAAYLCFKIFRNNMFTYHIYSPVEFFLICLYFNTSSAFLKRTNIGIIIGVAGVVLSIINSWYFQPLNTFNSYYLLFEGTVIIILCLFSLCEILLADIPDFRKRSYFWITLALMFYWSVTYTGWGIYNLLDAGRSSLYIISERIIYTANLMFYLGIAAIFFNYHKLISSVK